MKQFGLTLIVIFLCLVAFHLLVLKPDKYVQSDMYEDIIKNEIIKVGINSDIKPFAFTDSRGNLCGYDVDLAKNIAEYLLNNREAVKFVPVTPENRLLKLSTGEVDIVIAAMTITPQREKLINFTIPYDNAGQALLVKSTSKITSMADVTGQNIGVIWGTTAEKNMQNLAPMANVIGFKSYREAYVALKDGAISAITSDDTILSGYALGDKDVKLLPKRYTREPYGIGFRKGKGAQKLEHALNYAINDMKQKNIMIRLHKKWIGQEYQEEIPVVQPEENNEIKEDTVEEEKDNLTDTIEETN